MKIVAGLSLSSLNPRVWKPDSPYYLPELRAVMVSYADLHRLPYLRKRAIESGLHAALEIPNHIQVYLDNGAFYFRSRERTISHADYEAFVEDSHPDWFPIPEDLIPAPQMSADEQRCCYERTMQVNQEYKQGEYTPVAHVGPHLAEYLRDFEQHGLIATKTRFALGGIVPNLLRSPKAVPFQRILDDLKTMRKTLAGKEIHVFGIGGTATLHLAALLGMDSVDSSGWRNRAARGIVQLPGSGDRSIADLGKWRGRAPDETEWKKLEICPCPACQLHGLAGVKSSGAIGFASRATHNLWTLLQEAQWISERLAAGTYQQEYTSHLYNTTYRPLIDRIIAGEQ